MAGMPPVSAQEIVLEDAFPNLIFERPVSFTSDGAGRLFVLEQFGRIRTFENRSDVEEAALFLDLQDRTVADPNRGEAGLLGMALHPGYAENGYFYVYYVTEEPAEEGGEARLRSVISRFTRSAADPAKAAPESEHILLQVDKPTPNHNGGNLAFGPDGYLYISLGDGSRGRDTFHQSQDRTTLLGSLLRIDADNPSGGRPYGIPPDNPYAGNTEGFREEIYAYGFRNPWRFSFDAETGDLWVGDVGEESRGAPGGTLSLPP